MMFIKCPYFGYYSVMVHDDVIVVTNHINAINSLKYGFQSINVNLHWFDVCNYKTHLYFETKYIV